MDSARYHKLQIGNHTLQPETLMLGYGYDPALSEGSAKPPVFLTSTFVFRSAEDGRDFFDYTAGRREPPPEGRSGLVYSRFNHPNLEIVEDRLAVYEKAEQGLVFSSGMAAISTTILTYLRPGEVILHSRPLYGGTEVLIEKTLTPFGIEAEGFIDGLDEADDPRCGRPRHGEGPRRHDLHRDAVQSDEYAGRHRAGAADRRSDRHRAGVAADHRLR